MRTIEVSWPIIGDPIADARMAVHHGEQEVRVLYGDAHVRVWRAGAGIEGIKVECLPNNRRARQP